MPTPDPSRVSSHEWRVRVYYEDTDCGGVVYHTAYLRFMERARTEWLRERGFEQHRLAADTDRLFVVRGLSIDYKRPALLDDELAIESTVRSVGKARLLFEQTAKREVSSEVCCHGRVEVVCMRASDNRPCGFPESLRAELIDVD